MTPSSPTGPRKALLAGGFLSLALAFAAPALAQGTMGGAPAAAGDCAPSGGFSYLCGMTNAEDMVIIPGTRWIITGGLGTRDGAAPPGSVRLVDTRAGTWTQAYPTWRQWYPADPANKFERDRVDPGCSGPPSPATLSLHGIALSARGNGRYALYGINHAQTERIEAFEVDARPAVPTVKWVGCVPFEPKELKPNSLVVTTDGTILVTVLSLPGKTREEMLAGGKTGGVYRWRRGDKAFAFVPGTDLAGNNGIEIAPDGKTFYVAAFGDKSLVAYSMADTSRPLWKAKVEGFWPDNVHWDDRGRLILAGMNHNYDDCVDRPLVKPAKPLACERKFYVAAVDPVTHRTTPIASGLTNPLYSNVATAIVMGGKVWLGAYRADRLAYFAEPGRAKPSSPKDK